MAPFLLSCPTNIKPIRQPHGRNHHAKNSAIQRTKTRGEEQNSGAKSDAEHVKIRSARFLNRLAHRTSRTPFQEKIYFFSIEACSCFHS